MVKCRAQGHERGDRPGRDSNPHMLTTLESDALDRSATTLPYIRYMAVIYMPSITSYVYVDPWMCFVT